MILWLLIKIVEHEPEEVRKFLEDATRNHDRIANTTDLKPEYRKNTNDLKFLLIL